MALVDVNMLAKSIDERQISEFARSCRQVSSFISPLQTQQEPYTTLEKIVTYEDMHVKPSTVAHYERWWYDGG